MQKLTGDADFIVRESAFFYLLFGSFFLAVFVVSLTTKLSPGEAGGFPFFTLMLTLIPGIALVWRGLSPKPVIIKINRHGFFYFGRLITDWNHFVKASVTQKEVAFSLQDNFMLVLRYQKLQGGVFEQQFPLTNRQNKAEEEVLAAIRFYYQQHVQTQTG